MKKIVLACGLIGILSSFLAGCGGPDCGAYYDAAEAKATECDVEITGVGSEPTGDACTQAAADLSTCYAGCIDALTCDGLSGTDLDNLTAYSDCISACAADAQ